MNKISKSSIKAGSAVLRRPGVLRGKDKSIKVTLGFCTQGEGLILVLTLGNKRRVGAQGHRY